MRLFIVKINLAQQSDRHFFPIFKESTLVDNREVRTDKINLTCIILFLAFTPKVNAQSDRGSYIERNGSKYPAQVDLNNQFSDQIKIQQGGTCHIFASVAIFEAACFRKTGKRIDVSEGYLFYQHLKNTISTLDYLEPKSIGKNGYVFSEDTDCGYPWDSIKNIFDHKVCSGNEFPFNTSFRKNITELKASAISIEKRTSKILQDKNSRDKSTADQLAKNVIEEKLPKEACSKLDDYAKCTLKSEKINSPWKNSDSKDFSANKNLQYCLNSGLTARRQSHPSYDTLLSLLSKNIPFICSTVLSIDDGEPGAHSTTIIGYEYSTDEKYSQNIKFKVRDSNFKKPIHGGNLDCTEIIWIE